MRRCGKQLTKKELDLKIISEYVLGGDLKKAIEYACNENINEKEFASIVAKVEKLTRTAKEEIYIIVEEYEDGSKSIIKGLKGTSYRTSEIPSKMTYSSRAKALNALEKFNSNKSSLTKEYTIEKINRIDLAKN